MNVTLAKLGLLVLFVAACGGPFVRPRDSANPAMTIDAGSGGVPIPTARPLDCGNEMTLVDTTGAVTSCDSTAFGPDSAVGLIANGDEITARWNGAMCLPVVTASLAASET